MLRFATSPTRSLNIVNLRVAIFNYIVSKQKNEDLLIRIDDTNRNKNIEAEDKKILELLNLFSIEYSQVVYQSENLKHYQRIAMQLLSAKNAFSCFCSDEKLLELKELAKKNSKEYVYDGFCATLSEETVFNCNAPFTIRIKIPKEKIQVNDLLQGAIDYEVSKIDSFFILNHDKTPTYDYACAIDDMLYNISTVIRSEDYLCNAAKQIHVRNYLSYDKKINYVHLPKLLNGNGILVQDLINEGFLPSAIANYIVLLGNETPQEIFTLEDAIKWFDITKVSKKEIKFDVDKLKEINKIHLNNMDELRLSKLLGFADINIGLLAKLYLEECFTLKDLKTKISTIFAAKTACEDFEKEEKVLIECLKSAPFHDNFKELKNYIVKQTSLNDITLDKTLRYVLTGTLNGPSIEDIYPLLKNYLGEIVK